MTTVHVQFILVCVAEGLSMQGSTVQFQLYCVAVNTPKKNRTFSVNFSNAISIQIFLNGG